MSAVRIISVPGMIHFIAAPGTGMIGPGAEHTRMAGILPIILMVITIRGITLITIMITTMVVVIMRVEAPLMNQAAKIFARTA